MTQLRGGRTLITGSASGIGRLMAERFAEQGSSLVLWDIDEAALARAQHELQARGATVDVDVVDVSSREAVYAAAKKTGAIDVLVNNAGIVSGTSLLDTPDERIEATMGVNTMSLFWTTKAFLPGMIERGFGHLVTIASAAGLVGARGLADYCASKFAAIGFDEAMRMELRHSCPEVRTTVVCPYYINTGMFDGVQTRFPWLIPILEPQEVADAVVEAVQENRPRVIMPPFVRSVPAFRILPQVVFDLAADFLGVNAAMKEFKGRARPAGQAR